MGIFGGTPRGGTTPSGADKPVGKRHGGYLHSDPKDKSTGKHGAPTDDDIEAEINAIYGSGGGKS